MQLIRDLFTRWRVETFLILFFSALGLAASVIWHADMKPVTRIAGISGPVVFSAAVLILMGVLPLVGLFPWLAVARRALLTISIGSVFIFASMYRAESFWAPFVKRFTPQEVVQLIATNQDLDRYQAWARLQTMGRDERIHVAEGLAEVLRSPDEGARSSAMLTLDMPLRKFTVTVLLKLRPDLEAWVQARPGMELSEQAREAGEFARYFVAKDYRSMLKALSPKHRKKLPPGGLEVLVLAMATDPVMGTMILNGFAQNGDDTLRPVAQSVLAMAPPRI
jgi:hypothetical protein